MVEIITASSSEEEQHHISINFWRWWDCEGDKIYSSISSSFFRRQNQNMSSLLQQLFFWFRRFESDVLCSVLLGISSYHIHTVICATFLFYIHFFLESFYFLFLLPSTMSLPHICICSRIYAPVYRIRLCISSPSYILNTVYYVLFWRLSLWKNDR